MEKLTCALCGLGSRDTDGIETECTIINPENNQKLLYGQTVCADCREADGREQFLAMTTSYYDWTSETSRTYDRLVKLMTEGDYDNESVDSILKDYLSDGAKKEIGADELTITFARMRDDVGSLS